MFLHQVIIPFASSEVLTVANEHFLASFHIYECLQLKHTNFLMLILNRRSAAWICMIASSTRTQKHDAVWFLFVTDTIVACFLQVPPSGQELILTTYAHHGAILDRDTSQYGSLWNVDHGPPAVACTWDGRRSELSCKVLIERSFVDCFPPRLGHAGEGPRECAQLPACHANSTAECE